MQVCRIDNGKLFTTKFFSNKWQQSADGEQCEQHWGIPVSVK